MIIKINGIYRHYKGKLYQVLNIGKDAETLEDVVIYKDRNNIIWVRSYKIFTEVLTINNSEIPRFQLLSELMSDTKISKSEF